MYNTLLREGPPAAPAYMCFELLPMCSRQQSSAPLATPNAGTFGHRLLAPHNRDYITHNLQHGIAAHAFLHTISEVLLQLADN